VALSRHYPAICSEELRKTVNTVRVACVLAEMRNEDVSNTSVTTKLACSLDLVKEESLPGNNFKSGSLSPSSLQ
jgi:hypothetical protein